MSNVTLSLFAGVGAQFFNNDGIPLSGGKIYTYSAGTTTPASTYTTNVGNIAHPNPIILDSAGRVPTGEIWLLVGFGYKFVVKDSSDALIATYDNVPTSSIAPIINDASSIAYEQGYTVTAGSFIVGATYQILSIGTTDFTLIGATSNTVGSHFVATGIGSGTGTAKLSVTVEGKLQQTLSVLDFIPQSEWAAILSGTSTFDCLPAFNAAIASIPDNAEFGPYSGGNTINVPQGKYKLSGQLSIERQIILSGVTTPDGNAWSGSILEFPTGTTGIRIYDYRTSPNGTDAGGTTIQNLVIRTTRNSPAVEGGYHGIHADTRFTVRNCVITYFGDCGINIVATSGGSPNGNANNWSIDNVRCAENGYDGLFVDGADTNAGVAIRLDCSANLRWGIYDSSFLGNTYVGCHTASNVVGAYKTDNANARNVLLGCYSESGQPASQLVAPTLVLGGIHAAGFDSANTAYMFNDGKLLAQDGSVSTPSLSFASDADTGFYRTASGVMQIAYNGVSKGILQDGAVKFSTSGTYWSVSQAAHEFVQDSATIHSSIDYLTSTSYTGLGKYINCATAAGTGFNLITAANASAQAFLVLGNGNVQNTNNSYAGISDIKLKQDVVDATSQWADVKAIRLRKYRFKSDPTGSLQLGVIAQELETVSPGLVEEVPDRDNEGQPTGEHTKTVKYSVLLLKALGALQEAMARIEKLEQQIESLK